MRKTRFFKKPIIIIIITIITITIISIMLKYHVEGETNMPFSISKIMVISSAGGIQRSDATSKWDLDLVQYNDIYIDIKKNKNYNKQEIIDKIIIDNFVIEKQPEVGKINLYRPDGKTNIIYSNKEEYKVKDKIEYTGEEKSDLGNLQIANQGGIIILQYVNEDLGRYISNDVDEVKHDGTLLKHADITSEQLTFKISFDLSIELKSDKNYKTTITLEIPKGDLLQEGTTNYELNNPRDIVFKRY